MHKTYCAFTRLDKATGQRKATGGGWQVRIHSGPGGTKMFSNAKHGGKEGAEAAADAYMAKIQKHLPKDKRQPWRPSTDKHSTGVKYVRLLWREGRLATYLYLQAARYVEGKAAPEQTSVSLERHGIAEGVRVAVEYAGYQGDDAAAAIAKIKRAVAAAVRGV